MEHNGSFSILAQLITRDPMYLQLALFVALGLAAQTFKIVFQSARRFSERFRRPQVNLKGIS